MAANDEFSSLGIKRYLAMTFPQPFQYQGSKRALAPLILRYLPADMTRLVEPFCGSAAGGCSAAVRGSGFRHRPGACFNDWRRDAAATRRRDACATNAGATGPLSSYAG
jgi:hypothetical protein